jgi:hypothetical protein
MRIRRSKEEIARVMDQYLSSGMSRAEFCRRSGIPLGTMSNYCRRHSAHTFVQVEVETADGPAGQIAIVLAGGRRVEVATEFDDTALLRVIRIVEAA